MSSQSSTQPVIRDQQRQSIAATEPPQPARMQVTKMLTTKEAAALLIWSELSIPLFILVLVLILVLMVVFLLRVERVAIEIAFATVDQSDIRGSSRIIVIRRELPHTRDAGRAARPVA